MQRAFAERTDVARMDKPQLPPVARGQAAPLVSAIDGRLRAMLTAGDLVAGAKLNENALAQQLQVSRSALREAVRRLEQSGLVTIVPNRGVFIRHVGLSEILDLFDVHAGLARSAGRLLATRVTADQVEALEAQHAAMLEANRDAAVDRYRTLNATFHNDLFGYAGNTRLATLHAGIAAELQLSRRHNLGTLHQLRASVREHARILDAVRARDEERSARAFEQHVLAGKRRIVDTIATAAAVA